MDRNKKIYKLIVNVYGTLNWLEGDHDWHGQPAFYLPRKPKSFKEIVNFLKKRGITKWDVVADEMIINRKIDCDAFWWPKEWPASHNMN